METFRLLHLSDLHFADKHIAWKNELASVGDLFNWETLRSHFGGNNVFYPSTFDRDIALALSDYLSTQIRYVDAMLVTGDLATVGTTGALAVARDFFLGNIPDNWRVESLFKYKLIGDESMFVMLPGNHDRFRDVPKWTLPGGKIYEDVFGTDWSLSDYQASLTVHVLSDEIRLVQLVKDNEQLLVFCIDFTLRKLADCDRLGGAHLGQGRVYPDIVRELREWTEALCHPTNGPKAAAIWCLHFPPFDPDPADPKQVKMRLIDPRDLTTAARSCNVPVLIAGHVHKQSRSSLIDHGYELALLCAGTGCSVDADGDGNKLWELELDISNGDIVRINSDTIEFDADNCCFLRS